MKKVDYCFAFLGNPHTDSRILNISRSIDETGKSVCVIGFNWLNKSYPSKKDWKIINLSRRPALLFYLKFFVLLSLKLFTVKAKTYIAEDVYTLPITALIAKIRGDRLYYNSREFYTSIGGLAAKPFTQKLIAAVEKLFIRFVDVVLVTGEMDKEYIEKLYHPKQIIVIRNIPRRERAENKINFHDRFNIPDSYKILLYQGILVGGRGILPAIKTVASLENAALIIIGYGPEEKNILNYIKNNNLEQKVFLTGAVEHTELINYTSGADIGLALIENISTSYYYALPNKLFEYINAELCIIASPLPQMKKIIDEFKLGYTVEPDDLKSLKEKVTGLISDEKLLNDFKLNSRSAANRLNWQNEFERVKEYFS